MGRKLLIDFVVRGGDVVGGFFFLPWRPAYPDSVAREETMPLQRSIHQPKTKMSAERLSGALNPCSVDLPDGVQTAGFIFMWAVVGPDCVCYRDWAQNL